MFSGKTLNKSMEILKLKRWIKSDKEKQISYHLYVEYNLKSNANNLLNRNGLIDFKK